MKFLHKLTKEKYREGAEAALANARDHLKVAHLSAGVGCMGIGSSHLIMACEELCKAAILRIKALYPSLHIFDLQKYFHSHTIKHERAWEIFVALSQMPEISQQQEHKPETQPTGKMENGKVIVGLILSLILIVVLLLFSKRDETKKTENLEILRQRGLYVDLADDKSWKLPNHLIDEDAFREAASFVAKIFETIENHLFNKVLTKQELESLAVELGYLEQEVEQDK